jgi:hypothetical protein
MGTGRKERGNGVAKSWTINGVSDQTREAVVAAASEAGLSIGTWVEQALGKALTEGLEAGVSIEEIEARLRQVVADALQPVQQVLTRLETMPSAAPSPPDNSSSVRLLRARMRQRRGR